MYSCFEAQDADVQPLMVRKSQPNSVSKVAICRETVASDEITQVQLASLEYAPSPSRMTPCVLDVAGVHAQLPLQVTTEVKNDAMFAPELHSH